MISLSQLQEIPSKNLILLVGPPGSRKSTFCHQVVLNSFAMDRPIIFATTEHGPSEVISLLRERGMGELTVGALSFIDAFGETVGATTSKRLDTVSANCEDLTSISMAVTKLQERIDSRNILLVFDSLTSPYLFNEKEMFRFIRLCLAKFASEGNSVLALIDEGCGKDEDLVAMMSIADGILKLKTQELSRTLNVIKHPRLKPSKINIPIESKEPQVKPSINWDLTVLRPFLQSMMKGKVLRRETGDFVNLFWPNLAHWSCMLWDPKGFPTMLYEMNKYETASGEDSIPGMPLEFKFFFRVWPSLRSLGLFPKSLSNVRDMKKMAPYISSMSVDKEHSGIMEYLGDLSKVDEHYFRVYENCDCLGLENIGTNIASHIPPMVAGFCKMLEQDGREWNAIETKCLGLGDPYCEFKLVPGEIDGLSASLEKDSSLVERIHDRLMDRLMGFLLNGKPLVERHRLGSDVHLHVVVHGMGELNLVGERYRRAQMMGAARSANIIGERLMVAGLSEDEAVKSVLHFLEYCKVGKVILGETIRIRDNCESLRTTLFVHEKQPSCFFTTGFLNGFFSAVKNQHVKETRCIAMGDPYCEWEFR